MKVRSGFEDLVIAGGVESMSRLSRVQTVVHGQWIPPLT
jgi:acetyl-CoA acetyltransferase